MDIAKADAFGVEIRNDIKATIIRLNIATAARFSSGGTEIMETQRKIKTPYKYNHCHSAALIKKIMKQLATADKQRDRAAVVTPKGFANLVTDNLQELVDADNSNLFTEDKSAPAATSDSESSAER